MGPLAAPWLRSQLMWFLADVIGLLSINVGSFSFNVVPDARILSVNVVSKNRCSVPVIYIIGPLHLGLHSSASHNNMLSIRTENMVESCHLSLF